MKTIIDKSDNRVTKECIDLIEAIINITSKGKSVEIKWDKKNDCFKVYEVQKRVVS